MVGARDSVIAVGDMKTITTTYGVRNRCPDEFGSFSETPGDFHTIGYSMEVTSRLYESSGFFYVIGPILFYLFLFYFIILPHRINYM